MLPPVQLLVTNQKLRPKPPRWPVSSELGSWEGAALARKWLPCFFWGCLHRQRLSEEERAWQLGAAGSWGTGDILGALVPRLVGVYAEI